jgi:hypothetical protein
MQPSTGLEHPSGFLKSDDGAFHTTEDQRSHDGIEGVIGKGEVFDVGGDQSGVRVQSGSGLRDGRFVKLSCHYVRVRWIMIEIWPPARTHLQHKTVHIAQQLTAPISNKGNVTRAAHVMYSTIAERPEELPIALGALSVSLHSYE